MTFDAQPAEEPRGVLVIPGSTIALKNFRLWIDDSGEVQANLEPQIAFEMWPLWMRVAIDHEQSARVARQQLIDATDDTQRAAALNDETRAGMVAISACAFALESMAISVATRASLHGVGKSKSAGRRVAEVLRQCFAVPNHQVTQWRKAVLDVFRFRNWAVHPDSAAQDPMEHPGLRAFVPRPANLYRLENSVGSVDVTLSTVAKLPRVPRPGRGPNFAQSMKAWSTFGEDLVQHRSSLRGAAASDEH